jgi:hypothetical protein
VFVRRVVDLEGAFEEASGAGNCLVEVVAHQPEGRPSLPVQAPTRLGQAHGRILSPARARLAGKRDRTAVAGR